MKKKWLSKEKLIHYLLIVSIIVVGIIGIYVLNLLANDAWENVSNAVKSVLNPFVIAFFLSFIIGPLARLIERKLKINQNLSIIIAIFIGIIFILGILLLLILYFVSQLTSIINSLIGLVDNTSVTEILIQINTVLANYIENTNISSIIHDILNNGATIDRVLNIASVIFVSLSNLTSNIFSALMIVVLTPVFLFYLIREKELIFTTIAKVIPKKLRKHTIELGKLSSDVIKNYFRGHGIMMLLIFIYFSIAFSVISLFVPGFPIWMALVFALFMGLFNIVPYLGAWISLALPIIFLLTKHLTTIQEQTTTNIYFIAILLVLIVHIIEQAMESNIVQPHVVGKQVHIHPLAVISSLIFFGGIFGFAGVLLAVPLAGTIKATFIYLRQLDESDKNSEKSKPAKNNS
ncbi:MAG: AI-2E family transporter [Bacillota bacterium]